MNILINCSNIKIGGGIQVSSSFLMEIAQNEFHNFIIVLSSTLNDYVTKNEFSKKHTFIKYDIEAGVKNSVFAKNNFLDNVVSENNIERVFTIFGPSYWKPNVKHICGFAKPQYIYNDSPFFKELPLLERLSLKIKRFFHLFSFNKTVDTFITESWDVSQKLKKIFPNKEVFTVTNTYNQVFKNQELWEKNIFLPIFKGITLLTISANYPHKNLKIIPDVISYLRKKMKGFEFRFVLTLDKEDLKIEDSQILDNILFIGKIKVNQCPYLYEQADIMFLPTLLECFSATYPEAMEMDIPILTSNLDFANSICGNAAEYFEPLDSKDIAEKIYSLALNKERQNQLKRFGKIRLNNFDSPELRAKKYLEIITA